MTTQLKKYPLLLNNKQIAWLWDTAGIEDKLYSSGEFSYLLQGNLSHGMELSQPVSDRTPGFNPIPDESDRVDCVIMCIAASDASDEDTTKRLRLFNSTSRQREVASMLVVTKVCACANARAHNHTHTHNTTPHDG